MQIDVTCQELTIQVQSQGQGVPLILCHGGPAAENYLDDLAELLPTGFQILNYDQRGGGKSIGPGPYTVAQLIADLEQIRLSIQAEQWVLVGHSWGAFLALAYAAAYPEHTQALVHLSGTGLDQGWHAAYQQNRRKALSHIEQLEYLHLRQDFDSACAGGKRKNNQRIKALNFKADLYDPERVPELLKKHQYPVQRQIQAALMQDWDAYLQDPEFARSVQGISCPTLSLHGSHDPRPDTGAKDLVTLVQRGEFQSIATAGHYPWIEQSETTAAVLNAFLSPLL